MDLAQLTLLCAPASALVYLGLSLLLGDRFPFSRYSMYAGVADRDHGAVPVVFGDGTEGEIDQFDHISGIHPRDIYPEGIACSLQWRVHEMERWVESHTAGAGSELGRVKIEIGFMIFHVDAAGQISRELRITARGHGRRR